MATKKKAPGFSMQKTFKAVGWMPTAEKNVKQMMDNGSFDFDPAKALIWTRKSDANTVPLRKVRVTVEIRVEEV